MRRQIVIMLLGLMTSLSLPAFAIAGSRNTNGHETTRQDFFAYDRRGNLLSTAIGGGMPTAYRWNTESSTLAASLAGGRETASERADSVMTTFYTYEPLVGCTGITRPDGRHTGYDDQGGRLSEITNNRGEPTNSYDYSLYDGNGTNHIRQTTHLDLGQHALITDNYYDGFGAEVNNIQRHHSPSVKDIVTVIGYDAIGRKTEQWLPVPMAGCDGIVTNVGLHTASAQTYSDSHAVMRYQYEPQSGGELTATIPAGENYYNHPATVQKLCSDPSKAELCCRRFILSGDYKVKAEKTMKLVNWMWFYQPMPMGAVNGHLSIGAGRKCLTVVIRAQVWLTPIIYMTLLATCAWCCHPPHRLYSLPATARMTHGQT